MPFFVSKNGQTFGPHEPGEIAVFLRTGTFSPDDFCWQEGWNEWRPISAALPGFASPPAPAVAPPGATTPVGPAPPPIGRRIPEDVEIIGTLKLTDQQTLACRIEGSVESTSSLTIAKEGVIKAKITAESLVVFGAIEGDIHVDGLVVLKSTAVLQGDIHASRIVMEDGAAFNGASHVGARKPDKEKATSRPPSGADAKSPAPRA